MHGNGALSLIGGSRACAVDVADIGDPLVMRVGATLLLVDATGWMHGVDIVDAMPSRSLLHEEITKIEDETVSVGDVASYPLLHVDRMDFPRA